MARIQLSVVQIEGTWRILLDGEGLGRFLRRSAAVDCAREIARYSRDDGVQVELLAQDGFGEITVLKPEAAHGRPSPLDVFRRKLQAA